MSIFNPERFYVTIADRNVVCARKFLTTYLYTKKNSETWAPRDRIIPTERPPLVGEVSDNFCHVVSVTDPYGRILGFLDRSRYYLFQVAPHLSSRG
jgi:hypothetical protein